MGRLAIHVQLCEHQLVSRRWSNKESFSLVRPGFLVGAAYSALLFITPLPCQHDLQNCHFGVFDAAALWCCAGLSCLVSLMELYCGGNQIEEVREVGHLRGLPKLIILDLTGNPMAAHEDYRLYTIYHLSKLKVQSCCTLSINQSMEFTVHVGEPDVTHRTSWFASTGECSGRPKAFGQHCVLCMQIYLQHSHLSTYVYASNPPCFPPSCLSMTSCNFAPLWASGSQKHRRSNKQTTSISPTCTVQSTSKCSHDIRYKTIHH